MKSAIRTVRPALFASAMSLAILSSPVTAHTPHATSGSGAPQVNADEPRDPRARVGHANAAARVQPERSGYLGAIQQYAWTEGALFQIYAAPGQVTDIGLQEGEELIGPGPVASGDTVRWIIGDTISGAGNTRRVHILVKPTRADIAIEAGTHMLITVQDNGRGFGEQVADRFGLMGMRERAEGLGGEFRLSSEQGVHVQVKLPLRMAEES